MLRVFAKGSGAQWIPGLRKGQRCAVDPGSSQGATVGNGSRVFARDDKNFARDDIPLVRDDKNLPVMTK
jgi:hypothetical protein